MIWLTSDNAGPAAPEVMAAVAACNAGYTPGYGAEEAMARVTARIREVFEAPEAAVHLVATGTAGNALALSALVPPYGTVYCHRQSHIEEDECGAPVFYTGGAALTLLEGAGAKISPEALAAALATGKAASVHNVQPGALSLTNVTELGAVYSVAEVAELAGMAKGLGIPVHMDGARFANAIVATGASPAEMTWKAGVDVLTFGGTKNGCMGVEAVIFFDPAKSMEFQLRRKRGGHLFSKHRYLSAQMEAYLADDLWLDLAGRANAACARLVSGLEARGRTIRNGGAANMVFAEWSRADHARLRDAGVRYYPWPHTAAETGPEEEILGCRLVCNWATTEAEIDGFLALL